MLEVRGIWLCHMSRWDRYVLRPRVRAETSKSETVPHIGPYNYIEPPFPFDTMHKCLVADVRLAGMLDTHLCFISPLCFACSAAAVDVGAQEQEYPGGGYYYVETPADQDQE